MTAGVPASSEPPASMPLTQRSFSSDQRRTTRGHILGGRIVPARNSRISGSMWSSRSAGSRIGSRSNSRSGRPCGMSGSVADPRPVGRPALSPPGPPAPPRPTAAPGQREAEDRGLVEVERDRVVIAVGDRAPFVLHARTEDGPIRLELARLGDRDVLDHAQPHGQAGARRDRDEDAALLHERLQVGQPFETQAAADIVRLVDTPEVRGQLGGLEWDRAAEVGAVVEQALPDAVDQGRETRRDGGKDDHVVLRLQVGRGADILVGDVGVGHFAFVQGQAEPAVVLRVDPGVEQGDPRHGDRVALHLDLAADGVRAQPERRRGRPESREEVFGVSRRTG